jgi:sugar phosphate isomerase/epimerase
MKLSALASSLPLKLPIAIGAIADLGFSWIDIPPTNDDADRQALRAHDLRVACVALERDQPPDLDLASDDVDVRDRSRAYFQRAITETANLNAPVAYLTPPVTSNGSMLGRWTDSLVSLADCAETHGVRLCIEHFPRRVLPTVAATLQFLDEIGHDALAILIDVGHCLISDEDAAEAVVESGDRLGYLHFDDNDGIDDLHWALQDGRLTESQINAVIDAAQSSNYEGALSIELNPTLNQPLENLRRSRDILHRCVASRS